MNILEVKHLSKKYGDKAVISDLSLSVPKGVIYGFVGENGAGKTTTMKMILGLEEKTSGEILINGIPVSFGNNKTNDMTGYLPDVPEFYNYMTAQEYLKFCGELTGLSKEQLKTKISDILSLVGLAVDKKKIKGYSRGMKQRLGIAQALLNDPELLICDEPTSALDPSGRNEFLEMLVKLKGRMTILFSTHILNDVERICDQIGILNHGKLVVDGSLSELKNKYAKKQVEIIFSIDEELKNFNESLEELKANHLLENYSLDAKKKVFLLEYSQRYEELAAKLFQKFEKNNVYPQLIRKIEPSLESIFLEVVE